MGAPLRSWTCAPRRWPRVRFSAAVSLRVVPAGSFDSTTRGITRMSLKLEHVKAEAGGLVGIPTGGETGGGWARASNVHKGASATPQPRPPKVRQVGSAATSLQRPEMFEENTDLSEGNFIDERKKHEKQDKVCS